MVEKEKHNQRSDKFSTTKEGNLQYTEKNEILKPELRWALAKNSRSRCNCNREAISLTRFRHR